MFVIYKKKDTKEKKSPKKKKIFAQINSSPIKPQEKLVLSNNSSSFISNSSFDSGKALTNFLLNEQNTLDNKTIKNEFLSKKIKFHVDYSDTDKEKPKNISHEIDSVKNKKKKKSKIIIQSTEDDVNEGRWDASEHMRFIEAINFYGNEWKEVQKYIGTRSSNQVRSHAQKFFLKLKTFKDPSLGIDFTVDSVKNFSNVISIIKEIEETKNVSNILFILNQRLTERNFRINNENVNNDNEAFIINDHVSDSNLLINNEYNSKNQKNITPKHFVVQNENNKIFTNNVINKKEKKIVKFCKIKINKNNKSKGINEQEINNNQIKREESNKMLEISNNKKGNDERFYENENFNNNIIEAFINDDSNNSNHFECETNANYSYSFSNCLKETNTISLINRDYYC
jgi:SHAQKYF class myb-like DNA-binding protein